jgi:hypothetical protein
MGPSLRWGDVWSGRMKDVLKIVVAIVVIVIAWKLLKGIIGLAIGIALAGLVVYGGMKLIEGPRR